MKYVKKFCVINFVVILNLDYYENQRYKIVVDFVRSAPKGMYVDSKLNIVALKCDGVTLECDDKQPSIHFIKENGVYKIED